MVEGRWVSTTPLVSVVDANRVAAHNQRVTIVLRRRRYRLALAWLLVLVPVPLICLGGALFLVWQIHGTPAASWYRLLMYYVSLGASPTLAAIIGWRTGKSPIRTIAFSAAGFVSFFVWLVIYLEVHSWVTGVPIVGND